ncbi:MAG: hypothetical protein Q9227_001715 [Pyrenula ochraceoflavens]
MPGFLDLEIPQDDFKADSIVSAFTNIHEKSITHSAAFRRNSAKVGFFDLPRELRDSIYTYSIDSHSPVLNGDSKPPCSKSDTLHQHSDHCLEVTAARPLAIRLDQTGLNAWLRTTSYISKRFAAESAEIFWSTYSSVTLRSAQDTASNASHQLNTTSFETLYNFLRALGPHIAKCLRRLEVQVNCWLEPDIEAAERALERLWISEFLDWGSRNGGEVGMVLRVTKLFSPDFRDAVSNWRVSVGQGGKVMITRDFQRKEEEG